MREIRGCVERRSTGAQDGRVDRSLGRVVPQAGPEELGASMQDCHQLGLSVGRDLVMQTARAAGGIGADQIFLRRREPIKFRGQGRQVANLVTCAPAIRERPPAEQPAAPGQGLP